MESVLSVSALGAPAGPLRVIANGPYPVRSPSLSRESVVQTLSKATPVTQKLLSNEYRYSPLATPLYATRVVRNPSYEKESICVVLSGTGAALRVIDPTRSVLSK